MEEKRNKWLQWWKKSRSFGNTSKGREQIICSKLELLPAQWRKCNLRMGAWKHIKVKRKTHKLETKKLTWKNREGTFFDLDTPWRSIDSNLTNCTLSLAICCLINSIWENRWRRVGFPRPFTSGSLLNARSEEECSRQTK